MLCLSRLVWDDSQCDLLNATSMSRRRLWVCMSCFSGNTVWVDHERKVGCFLRQQPRSDEDRWEVKRHSPLWSYGKHEDTSETNTTKAKSRNPPPHGAQKNLNVQVIGEFYNVSDKVSRVAHNFEEEIGWRACRGGFQEREKRWNDWAAAILRRSGMSG